MPDEKLYLAVHKLRITNAMYQCRNCGFKQMIPQHGEKLVAPTSCPKCPCREFELLKEESEFQDLGIIGWRELKKNSLKKVCR